MKVLSVFKDCCESYEKNIWSMLWLKCNDLTWATQSGTKAGGLVLEIRLETYCTRHLLLRYCSNHQSNLCQRRYNRQLLSHHLFYTRSILTNSKDPSKPCLTPPNDTSLSMSFVPWLLSPGWRRSQSLDCWVVVWHLLQLRITLACVLAHTHSDTHTFTPLIRPGELMTKMAGL